MNLGEFRERQADELRGIPGEVGMQADELRGIQGEAARQINLGEFRERQAGR